MPDPVWQSLQTIRACAEELLRDHATVTFVMARGMNPATRGLSGGTSDPEGSVEWTDVERAGNTRLRVGVGEYQTLLEQACAQLLLADSIRNRCMQAQAGTQEIHAKAVELRCDGGAGEWDDPVCEREGVKDVWVGGHHHWLCQRCWDRYRQWKHREEQREAS